MNISSTVALSKRMSSPLHGFETFLHTLARKKKGVQECIENAHCGKRIDCCEEYSIGSGVVTVHLDFCDIQQHPFPFFEYRMREYV